MAEEATGETIELLRLERAKAKRAFINQATYLGKEARKLEKSKLLKEYDMLYAHARKVNCTNSNYELGLLAELGADEEDREVTLEMQQLKLEKTREDCKTKLTEVRGTVQSNLWDRYGRAELSIAIQEAESYSERALETPVSAAYKDAYELQVCDAKRSINEFTTALRQWEKWIPEEAKATLDRRLGNLRKQKVIFDERKAEHLVVLRSEGEGMREGTLQTKPAAQPALQPILKIKATSLPKFYGSKRDFHPWKKAWESLQKQGEPTGSTEDRRLQLLESVDGRICRDLRLSTYQTAEDIFRMLENRFGNKTKIAMEIVRDLDKIPILTSDQPRKVMDMIRTIEKALNDLIALNTEAIKNPLVINSIESKLPDAIMRHWLIFMTNPANGVTSDNHFDNLLRYLKDQEEVLELIEQIKACPKPEKRSVEPKPNESKRYASTKSTRKGGCVVCGDKRHREKLFFCKTFKNLKPKDKLSAVERLGACKKCLECHEDESECKDTYLCRKQSCARDHHFFLCQKRDRRQDQTRGGTN
ncbi:uncharacterized protein LOC144074933 [Stigmatopora argus]